MQVLSLTNGEVMGWGWAPYGEIPRDSVPCDDSALGSNNCFLGVSLYSDGICEEAVGKIDFDEAMIGMTYNRRPFHCPFFLYLIVASPADNVIVQDTF